jgi:putative FmdB family regulatory protein
MPFYEYECQSCKFYTEVMQKISEPPLVKCPSCGKRTLQKLVSAPVFRLKGSGWYETDFKSDKEGKRNLAEREEPKPAAEESKTEAKAPAAAESAAKPSEPKAPSATASVTTSAAAGKHHATPARKRPVTTKASTRPSASRGKAKPAARAKAAKRGGRR